jgi:hypothetical protein
LEEERRAQVKRDLEKMEQKMLEERRQREHFIQQQRERELEQIKAKAAARFSLPATSPRKLRPPLGPNSETIPSVTLPSPSIITLEVFETPEINLIPILDPSVDTITETSVAAPKPPEEEAETRDKEGDASQGAQAPETKKPEHSTEDPARAGGHPREHPEHSAEHFPGHPGHVRHSEHTGHSGRAVEHSGHPKHSRDPKKIGEPDADKENKKKTEEDEYLNFLRSHKQLSAMCADTSDSPASPSGSPESSGKLLRSLSQDRKSMNTLSSSFDAATGSTDTGKEKRKMRRPQSLILKGGPEQEKLARDFDARKTNYQLDLLVIFFFSSGDVHSPVALSFPSLFFSLLTPSSFLLPPYSFLLPPYSLLLPPSSFLLPPPSFLSRPRFTQRRRKRSSRG